MVKRGLGARGLLIFMLLLAALIVLFIPVNSPTGLQSLEGSLPVYVGGSFNVSESTPLTLPLSEYFVSPQNRSLSFVVQGEGVSLDGDALTFSSSVPGEHFVTVVVSDGENTLYKQLTFIVGGISVSQPSEPSDNSSQEEAQSELVQSSRSTSVERSIQAVVSCDSCASCTTCTGTSGNECVLNQSITATGSCIVVGASNVAVDCNGRSINYSTSASGQGVSAVSRVNVTVRNCAITQITSASSSYGINFDDSEVGLIVNNTITSSDSDSGAVIIH